ncbi:33008_t:CDS:2 [Gigaspora margarita]|uniref:33008_t:CDS:1 n=1 Tax=Gigaspora margarita TaxID=4874 RepID=A0ABM8W6Z7_GIGMA|nr:33008_t:CDS:2 [Gigaspora margarita]
MSRPRSSSQLNTRTLHPFWNNCTKEIFEEVVVTRKDRLCRFAYKLVEWILGKNSTKIMVLSSDNIDDTKSKIKNLKDTDVSNPRRKRKTKKVNGNHEMNIQQGS